MFPSLAFIPFESRLRDSLPGSWDECLKCLYQRPESTTKTLGIALHRWKRGHRWKKPNCTDITDINKMISSAKLVLSRISQSLSGEWQKPKRRQKRQTAAACDVTTGIAQWGSVIIPTIIQRIEWIITKLLGYTCASFHFKCWFLCSKETRQ